MPMPPPADMPVPPVPPLPPIAHVDRGMRIVHVTDTRDAKGRHHRSVRIDVEGDEADMRTAVRGQMVNMMAEVRAHEVEIRHIQAMRPIIDAQIRAALAQARVEMGRIDDAKISARVDAALAPVDHLVERYGWVRPQDFLPTVDLAVFPSTAAESFGLVAAEAMAAGVPFVTTDVGALPEVVGPAHRWLVPSRDPWSIVAAVEQVVAAGPERAAHLAASRRRW